MHASKRRASVCAALLAIALFAVGCSDDDSPTKPSIQPTAFKTLTTKENLIYNLVLSYQEKLIGEYEKLLLATDDGNYGKEYVWFFQESDVPPDGEPYLTRAEDILVTGNIFAAANGSPVKPEHPIIDKLQLDIDPGTWISVDSLWDEPCEDCWYTKRGYYIEIHVGEYIIYGDAYVEFYVVPVQVGDVTEYRIAFALDVME